MFKNKILLLVQIILFSVFSSSLYGIEPYVDAATLQRIEKKYNLFAKKRFIAQQSMFDALQDKSTQEKLQAVNDFYNQVRYGKDIKIYGQKDYWATPYEFLAKDRGDCEDYVIAKYFALKYLGIDPKKMYFTYVRSTRFKAPHMVLTYFKTPRSEPLILDNINLKIFPASRRKDLKPIYLFNAETLYKSRKRKRMKKNKKIHKKWDQLLYNIQRKKI